MASARSATAFAPASVGNAAVGFDVLGFSLDVVGDRITVEEIRGGSVEVRAIRGLVPELPKEAGRNTASVALSAMLRDQGLSTGFAVTIEKGIPLGSGMGGSAASAVGAVVAANALLPKPLPRERLLEYALAGEAVASGSAHADNIAPCLWGGLTLALCSGPVEVVSIPIPAGIHCALVHPHFVLETRAARAVLKPTVPLADSVRQSSLLAGFLAGCYRSDMGLIRRSLADTLIEPQRAPLIPGFAQAKRGAIEAGALGCSISGAGPSVFAWADSAEIGEKAAAAIRSAFSQAGLQSDSWVAPLSARGARLIEGPR